MVWKPKYKPIIRPIKPFVKVGGGGGKAVTPPTPPKIKHGMGWIKQHEDKRDFKFIPHPILKANLPTHYTLRPYMPPVVDQGNLGSCTANSIANAVYAEMLRQIWKKTGTEAWLPSRLFIYYNERAMEGTVDQDAGAEIRDGFKCINSQGVCPETEWPYDISKFTNKPGSTCYTDALKDKVVQYMAVTQDLADMKTCLASGYPFVFGFTVYDSFMSDAVAANGIVPMPNTNTESVQGGHAVLAVGYDDHYQRFLVENSWGTDWGMKGYFTIPYVYLANTDMANDFWTIRLIQQS